MVIGIYEQHVEMTVELKDFEDDPGIGMCRRMCSSREHKASMHALHISAYLGKRRYLNNTS
jgi:hypothetical protein